MRRRDLLRLAAAGACPGSWTALASEPTQTPPSAASARALVLVELKGGNDGLNTLVPYADDAYYRLRPRLALRPDSVLVLDERLGLHPALKPLMPAWAAGEVAWVQGLGYDQPNRSHFRSIDIWETASDADAVLDVGWIARALPAHDSGVRPDVVILTGDDGVARGGGLRLISLRTPEQFARAVGRFGDDNHPSEPNAALAHIVAVRAAAQQAGATFEGRLRRVPDAPDGFPQSPLGRQLQQVVRMMMAGMEIPVYKVQIGSFDTHANQPARHERLLAQLAEALSAFRASMVRAGRWKQVLVLTYSEFGRRVAQNASLGTDHGTAAPQLVLGGQVKGGLYGTAPDLSRLDEQGDLCYTTDYRRLYTTVAERWWGLERHPWVGQFPAMEWVHDTRGAETDA
jgi:uncharacterized protein (DUF1501 family)